MKRRKPEVIEAYDTFRSQAGLGASGRRKPWLITMGLTSLMKSSVTIRIDSS